ncbi:MAG: 2-oxo acid dehydrogenase subunit E2 [Lachnospiraceae bacterium]|nr:2-oxo acid dehydrogenase subunit E2 [Lachnospiraceae bacterium]
MATVVIMPRQGQSVESCIITSWAKKVGDEVKAGDVIFSYETDKSSFDETTEAEGVMLAEFYGEGDEVPCLENVCVIGAPGEDISQYTKGGAESETPKAEAEAPKEEKKAPEAVKEEALKASAKEEGGRVFASPRAKALAEKTGVDYRLASPTGAEGRIIERDIEALLDKGVQAAEPKKEEVKAEAAPAKTAEAPKAEEAVEFEDVKLSNVRKVIARSMHDSLANSAQLTLNMSFDATEIQAFRAAVKANGEAMGLANITLNDVVTFAAVKTLKDFPELNAHFLDDKIRLFKEVHMGVAVDTERGLLVPTVANASKMSLNEFSKAAKDLINEAKGGHINPDKLAGGTFTVTNLGSFGIESFTPVINPPQVAILGVCGITTQVKVAKDGSLKAYPAMGLSLTIDHRAVDGAPGAKFLKALCTNLEHFNQLLAK